MGTLVEDLLRPESYPPPPPARVCLAATHGSWVFLTDREAWKVKRPVDYGFMDFTTLEKRRHFCEEEVRLNRRLAPGVYVGVEPVRRDASGHSFVRGGEVVDHAVRMRRLPEEESALSMLRREALREADLTALARRLAAFYEAATPAPAFGSPEAVRAAVEQNFVQVEPYVGRFVDAATFETVRSWQQRFLEARAALFEARARAGRIRDGHGDLRLEHVYFVDGRPLVIDCIEFNESFRHCDAASDAAFLAMDLEREKRGDLAAWFLSRFAMEANDYDLYSIVDFYVGYRAWVRGKVASFVAAEGSTPLDKRARKAQEARGFFELARAYARQPPPPPWVVAVGGIIGTGKSTLAEALCRTLGFPVVGSDPTRKHLAGLPAAERGPQAIYSPEFSRRTFREVFRRAAAVLASGRGVILDATFRGRDLRLEARALAERSGAAFLFVETRCEEAELRERLRRRAREPSVSDAGEDLLEPFQKGFEPVTELPASERLVVDTTRGGDEALRAVLARLSEDRASPALPGGE